LGLALRWWEGAVVGLEGLLLLGGRTTETGPKHLGTSLQSVSNSETDVTVNLTSFVKLLVRQMTQKTQQNSWMDPSKDWGQSKGSQGVQKQ